MMSAMTALTSLTAVTPSLMSAKTVVKLAGFSGFSFGVGFGLRRRKERPFARSGAEQGFAVVGPRLHRLGNPRPILFENLKDVCDLGELGSPELFQVAMHLVRPLVIWQVSFDHQPADILRQLPERLLQQLNLFFVYIIHRYII